MLSAVFGLLGVIVGGLLTAAMQARHEARHEQRRLRIAARALVDELTSVSANVNFWRQESRKAASFSGEPLTATWLQHRADLVAVPWNAWLDIELAVNHGRMLGNAPVTSPLPEDHLDEVLEEIRRGIDTLIPYGIESRRERISRTLRAQRRP